MLQRIDTKATVLAADIDTALARSGWREFLPWPVSLSETNRVCAQQVRDALAFARNVDDELRRDAALLALPVVLAYGRAIILAALAIDRAQQRGQVVEGQAPELDYLKTGAGIAPTNPVSTIVAT